MPVQQILKSQKTIPQLERFREELLRKDIEIVWKKVKLAEGVVLEISEVVRAKEFYLPVRPTEVWQIARSTGAFPLTRAVADQLMNNASFLPYRWQPELKDFEQSSFYFRNNSYDGITKFGAHKLWVLSKRRGVDKTRSVNYGFYELSAGQSKGAIYHGGNKLDRKYNPHQGLGGAHDTNWWDYSQLLQLMRSFEPITIDGERLSLGMALNAGKSIVSDEGEYSHDDLNY